MKKELHVSPFWDMDHMYDWVFSSPQDKLNVFMKNFKDGKHVFDANLSMDRTEMTKKNLLKSFFSFPFMTIKVVFLTKCRCHRFSGQLQRPHAGQKQHKNK